MPIKRLSIIHVLGIAVLSLIVVAEAISGDLSMLIGIITTVLILLFVRCMHNIRSPLYYYDYMFIVLICFIIVILSARLYLYISN